MLADIADRRCSHPTSRVQRGVAGSFLVALVLGLAGCGGGSFDTGGPADTTLFLGSTNLQQINDFFVSDTSFDGITCANLACHGTDPENGAGLVGGGGFKFRNKTWALLTAEQRITQQRAFESRVDLANKAQSLILLRATLPGHSGGMRYTSGDQIYIWIEEWLQSVPTQ